ncbi:hypothetical protein TNCT_284811 [Trichonephila clavata]|uniref:Uncharacterized protein n=1 Tax=Trichonephila clavata TaxID=2740835 RepID=A0A8X6FZQ1_TRICU|nr:hypothetical protein TNCT_284811 [Trichonephila clavata]
MRRRLLPTNLDWVWSGNNRFWTPPPKSMACVRSGVPCDVTCALCVPLRRGAVLPPLNPLWLAGGPGLERVFFKELVFGVEGKIDLLTKFVTGFAFLVALFYSFSRSFCLLLWSSLMPKP